MAPGQRLVERELCEELDVSRNTIREACRQLEAEGFIEIPPHKGPVVAVITDRDAKDLFEFREALECFAVSLFVEKADEQTMHELSEAGEAVFAAHDSGDISSMITAKNHFYDVLYRGTDNRILGNQAKLLRGRLASLRARSLASSGRPERSKDEIREVLTAIVARNAGEAADLWRRHIRNAAFSALGQDEAALT
jgi:DNA-binding GntR family transcriptional regulator